MADLLAKQKMNFRGFTVIYRVPNNAIDIHVSPLKKVTVIIAVICYS